MKIKKQDLISGLIWVFLGGIICVGSVNLRLGNLQRPGPGFLPFLSGTFLILFGLMLGVYPIFKGIAKGGTNDKEIWTTMNWKSFSFTLLALLGYAFLLEFMGFYSSAFVFLFFLFKFKEPKKWVIPFITAGITVTVSYIIFSVWLKCQFPRGLIGF
jgi:hypothetical protein